MPAAAGSTEDVIASCSFCGKPHHKVTKVVAGPGVYICNECVDLCATIIADASRETREEAERLNVSYFDRPAGEILAMLPALARSAARVEAELAGWVGRSRQQGTGWPEIAGATGMGVEDARRRFEQRPPAQDVE